MRVLSLGSEIDRPAARVTPGWLVGLFLGAVVLLAFLGQSRIVNLGFAPAAVLFAVYLMVASPRHYIAFAMWLLFLGPFIRRVVDYHGGWDTISILSLVPYLVALLPLPAFLSRTLWPRRMADVAILCVGLGIAYALVVGVVENGIVPAGYGAAIWLAPLCLDCFIAVHAGEYEAIARTVLLNAALASLVMGIYGLVQFVAPAPWDAGWMTFAHMSSIGNPAPYSLRVFSTMNSPEPLGSTIAVLVLLLLPTGTPLALVAAAAGSLALFLSMARSAWFGVTAGIVYLGLNSRRRMQLYLGAAGIGLALMAALPANILDPILNRAGTLTSLDQDTSAEQRTEFYQTFAPIALTQVIGRGFGDTGLATKLTDTNTTVDFDSGLLEVPYEFGWLGGLLCLGGTISVLLFALRVAWRANDRFAKAAAAGVLAIVVEVPFYGVLEGAVGCFLWILIGLLYAHYLSSDEHSDRGNLPVPGNS
jgi:hypothetical protein